MRSRRYSNNRNSTPDFHLIFLGLVGVVAFLLLAQILSVKDALLTTVFAPSVSEAAASGNTSSDLSVCTADRAAVTSIVYGKQVTLNDLIAQQKAQPTKPLFNFVAVFGSGPVGLNDVNNMLFDRARERPLAGFLAVKKYGFANSFYFSGLNTSKTPEISTEMAFVQSPVVSGLFGTLASNQYVVGVKACSTVGNVSVTQNYYKSAYKNVGNVLIITSEFHIPRVLWLLNYYKLNAQVLSADEVLQAENGLAYKACTKQAEVNKEKSVLKSMQIGTPPWFIEWYACLSR